MNFFLDCVFLRVETDSNDFSPLIVLIILRCLYSMLLRGEGIGDKISFLTKLCKLSSDKCVKVKRRLFDDSRTLWTNDEN